MSNQLIASVISIAIGWGLAWLVAKGISCLLGDLTGPTCRSPELVALTRLERGC